MGIFLMPPDKGDFYEKAKEAYLIDQKMGSRYYEGEDDISKNPHYSVEYAKMVGRFEKGEPSISRDPKLSTYYAIKILKDRFVLGEESIAKSAYYTCAYSIHVLRGLKVDIIHHSMLKKGITDKNNYWVKEYCRYMEYLNGQGERPYWADENAAVNWF